MRPIYCNVLGYTKRRLFVIARLVNRRAKEKVECTLSSPPFNILHLLTKWPAVWKRTYYWETRRESPIHAKNQHTV